MNEFWGVLDSVVFKIERHDHGSRWMDRTTGIPYMSNNFKVSPDTLPVAEFDEVRYGTGDDSHPASGWELLSDDGKWVPSGRNGASIGELSFILYRHRRAIEKPKTVKIGAIARGESTGGEQVVPEADPRTLEIATTIIAGMYAGIYTDAGEYNCEIVANEAIDAARALIIAAGRGPQPDTKEG